VPCRSDNYAYLLIDDKTLKAAAIDPYDVPKVKAAAEKEGVDLVAVLTTHHHFDHAYVSHRAAWKEVRGRLTF
jgi:hydroxyacylglutathione hydrolase